VTMTLRPGDLVTVRRSGSTGTVVAVMDGAVLVEVKASAVYRWFPIADVVPLKPWFERARRAG